MKMKLLDENVSLSNRGCEMEKEEVYQRLCVYDPRHPDYYEDMKEYSPENPTNCFCDNCFYGRSKLAQQIIELQGWDNSVMDRTCK